MASDPLLGVQSVVYADLSLVDLIEELQTVPIDNLELWDAHLAPGDGEDEITAAEGKLADADISIVGYGVVDLEDVGEVRFYADLADRLGADYVTVNYPPDRDDITEELLAVADGFDLDVAIHNYSSVHHDDLSQVFSSIADVESVLERYDHPNLGVCVDTGHFLVEEVAPEDVISSLGDRVVAVHLKDTSEAEIEDLPGAGRLDLPHILELVDEHADHDVPLIIEYELPRERATAALEEAEANVRTAIPDGPRR